MKRSIWSVPASLLIAILVAYPTALPAQAPVPGLTVTLFGGASFDGELAPGLSVNTTLETGWVAGTQIEHYVGTGLLGFRVGGLYASRVLEDGSGKFDVAQFDLGGLVRPRILTGIEALQPYGALTLGGTVYMAVPGSPTLGGGAFGADPVIRGHVLPTVGMDIVFAPWLGARLEAGDRITFPSVGQSPPTNGTPIVHTPVVVLGLQYRLGAGPPNRREPERRTEPEEPEEPTVEEVVEEPEAPAEPEPEPEAEPDTAAAPAPAAAETAEAPAEAAYTVQVGTYLTPATARRWGERMTQRGIPVWYLDRTLGGSDVSRVRAGAAATEAELQPLLEIIEDEFGWDASIEAIGPADEVPPDAVTRTRELLDAG